MFQRSKQTNQDIKRPSALSQTVESQFGSELLCHSAQSHFDHNHLVVSHSKECHNMKFAGA
jgi:hypothetical protein